MTTLHEIDPSVLVIAADGAVQSVFSTMVGRRTRIVQQTVPDLWTITFDQIHVVGIVGVEGRINGQIHLCFSLPLAELCASRVLGPSLQKINGAGEKLVNDVVGELTNMTLGVFKNQLVELGLPCRLKLPTVCRSREFTLDQVPDAIRRQFRFDVAGHELIADLVLAAGD
jgi:chemotaxis protein CheX